jgi:hypothetical protein
MGRALPILAAVGGVAVLIASLVAQRPSTSETLAVETAAVEIPLVPDRLPPGVVDATGHGFFTRLFMELNPDLAPPEEWPLFTTRGPLTPEQLDAIRDSPRSGEGPINVLAYDPTLSGRVWTGDIVTHTFTLDDGWQTFLPSTPVVRGPLRRAPPPPQGPYYVLPLELKGPKTKILGQW